MLIIGLEGHELSERDIERLGAPEVSGAILFSRNFASRAQLDELIAEIRALRDDPFPICVDQEGGPVQRFKADGFTRLPPLGRIGALHDHEPAEAVRTAETHAWLMASELRACDVDLSFAPVVDLQRGNRVIGERAFHADPHVVAKLGTAYLRGMAAAGMVATVKHFPGHGTVAEDTHVEAATDPRDLETLRGSDLVPFAAALKAGAEAVMLAHVTYPAVDSSPAGYSRVWIGDILRGEYGFGGLVFSDDVGMAAAESAGGVGARVNAHLDAGCDLVLVCAPRLVDKALAAVGGRPPCDPARVSALCGAVCGDWRSLAENPQRTSALAALRKLEESARPERAA
ncbi:MAG TPA: beta-N-acetylhexosaminidase [Rhodanobacteraceae bacterium]|nr:beta-N-acetylhexosaminidase [Rhodanobacteraceae bacterium]